MKVISIINFKGGVGKTTITANIGSYFAKCGKKVLLIDLDPQANLTFSFVKEEDWKEKYRNTRTIKNLFNNYINHNVLLGLEELIILPENVNKQVGNNLHLISSHCNLYDTEIHLANKMIDTRKRVFKYTLRVLSILRKAIANLKTKYDVILIDCPPNFNIITKNAIAASDHFIVPIKLDYLSTFGIVELQAQIKSFVERYNHILTQKRFKIYDKINPTLEGIVCNMVYYVKDNELINIQKEFFEQLKNLELPLYKTMIRENHGTFAKNPDGIPAILGNGNDTYKPVKEELINLSTEVMSRTV